MLTVFEHTEGLSHGFLVLRTLEGKTLADGELIQIPHGARVTNHLVFRFKDGSIHDETTVFSQNRNFRLLNYYLVQKGPAFPHPIQVSIDTSKRRVAIHYTEDGKERVTTDRVEMPPDIANGVILTLLKNIQPDAPQTKVSMLAATPKPQLVKLAITPQGEEPFSIGDSSRRATHYIIKIEIGGVKGLLAPLLGKQPPDSHVWILEGEAPTFVKSEGPLYLGGPIWRIELTSPVWPAGPPADSMRGRSSVQRSHPNPDRRGRRQGGPPSGRTRSVTFCRHRAIRGAACLRPSHGLKLWWF